MQTYKKIKNKIEGKNKGFFNFFQIVFIIIALFLSFMIYAKNDENGSFLQKYFHLNVSFKDFNNKVGLNISRFLANLNIFTENDEDAKKVATNIYYLKDENNYYTYTSNEVPMLFYGKVLSINDAEKKYDINIYYSNGVNACYYGLESNYTNKGDILNKGDIIGTYEERFKVIFAKNNKIISYEEALLS